MARVEDRLNALGLVLPAPAAPPPGVEVRLEPVRLAGGLAYVSGHTPMDGSTPLVRGTVGGELTVDDGYEAARLTALAMIATLRHALGDLDRVARWVKALGFVRCAPGFTALPSVINGFSDTIVDVWGDAGRHARSAIGVAELPFDAPVEVEAVIELD